MNNYQITEKNTFEILSVKKEKSRFGGHFFYIFLKCRENGTSWRLAIYPDYRNAERWQRLIYLGHDEERLKSYNNGIVLYNLRQLVRKGNLMKGQIDGDSLPGKLYTPNKNICKSISSEV